MASLQLIVVTGLPASGKSTLASVLAQRLGIPVIGKDLIKEPLFEVLGTGDRSHSRQLSTASFAIQFAVARELLTYDRTVILEGNFRPGEHERPLLAVLPAECDPAVAISQVLCRVEESERLARLRRRAFDPGRHSGHRDAELALTATHGGGAFLDLPGKRVECVSDASQADYEELAAIVLAANVNSRTV
jgi:predicted kinase